MSNDINDLDLDDDSDVIELFDNDNTESSIPDFLLQQQQNDKEFSSSATLASRPPSRSIDNRDINLTAVPDESSSLSKPMLTNLHSVRIFFFFGNFKPFY